MDARCAEAVGHAGADTLTMLSRQRRGRHGMALDRAAQLLDRASRSPRRPAARPHSRRADDLRAMVRRGTEFGLRVALADVLPWDNGWPDAEPDIRRLNGLIAAIARQEAVPVLPFHDTLEDPERPGRMRAEWTSDGDHPSVEGYHRLGEHAFALPD